MSYQPTRLQLADFIEHMKPADVAQLIDLVDYMGSLASPTNRNGHVPEGSLASLMLKQPPAVQTAIKGLVEVANTSRDLPFERKRADVEILDLLGFDAARGKTILDAFDGIEVTGKLMHRMGTDEERDWVKNPPNLRESIERAASVEEPKAHAMAHADREVAQAGAESRLPLRKHLEISSDIIGSNRGHDFDEGLITAKGNDGDLRDTIENAIITVADAMP